MYIAAMIMLNTVMQDSMRLGDKSRDYRRIMPVQDQTAAKMGSLWPDTGTR